MLSTHVLSLIATRFCRTEEDLAAFMATTFYGHTHRDTDALGPAIETALVFLLDAEMISDLSGRYEPTEYGSLVSRLYIDPVTAEQIAHALLEADAFTDVGMLQVLCATPDMPALYVKARDMDALSRFAYEREEELWMEFPWDSQETFYRALKTALLLADYVSEASEETICERYEVAPGDIHSAVTNIAWLVHAAVASGRDVPVRVRTERGRPRALRGARSAARAPAPDSPPRNRSRPGPPAAYERDHEPGGAPECRA